MLRIPILKLLALGAQLVLALVVVLAPEEEPDRRGTALQFPLLQTLIKTYEQDGNGQQMEDERNKIALQRERKQFINTRAARLRDWSLAWMRVSPAAPTLLLGLT